MKNNILLYLLLFPLICLAQDPHFSQPELAPLQLNPALTGTSIRGNYQQRLQANYRTQWGNFIDPGFGFSTANISLDGSICLSQSNNYWGIGANIMADEVGQLSQSLLAAHLTTAYGIQLKGLYMAAGAKLGLQHRQIKLSDLQFNEQFDSGYFRDFKNNGESFLSVNNLKKIIPDLGAGFTLFSNQKSFNDPAFSIGVSVDHLSEPNLNLLESANSTAVVLRRKWTVHASAMLPLGKKNQPIKRIAIQPRAVLYLQKPHWELQAGANIVFRFDQSGDEETKLKIGIFDRLVGDLDQFPLISDALIFSLGLDIQRFQFGLAYDVNISKLRAGSKTYGAIELAMGWVLGDTKKRCAPICHF